MVYTDAGGREITDEKVIRRIRELVIPPNWQEVWICKTANGHLQCTGRDERNRKQYLYHADWLAYSQKAKFQHLVAFGQCLPHMRRQINHLLSSEGYGRKKVLAIALKLLDLHYLRIGNDFYLSENETYGLTTLRRKHLTDHGRQIRLSYKAKSNKYRTIRVENKKLVRLLREMNELPGYEVFRYETCDGPRRIDSAGVNELIRELSGADFSAKDFRTWGGTVAAVEVWAKARKETAGTRRKLEVAIVREVAKILGNTVATAREYYIHPKVLKILTGEGPEPFEHQLDPRKYQGSYFKKSEALVLAMLTS